MARGDTVDAFSEQQEAARRARSLDAVAEALDEQIDVPPPVTEIRERKRGVLPKLSVEALELARQVYYLQHGSMRDAARAIIAADLAYTGDVTQVSERLHTWWARERWPKRRFASMIVVRDANHDGGLYRGRMCKGEATGTGPAPKGKPCAQSALDDSDYCVHHDPRPEYEERRRASGMRMARSRDRDLVALEPFGDWCAQRREQLLKSARMRGDRIDVKDQGWQLLAREMGVNYQGLWRTVNKPKRKERDNTVRASTIARYLANLDVTFEDIYGFERPAARGDYHTCPNCGGYKEHAAKRCRDCHDAQGAPCPYVNARNETCGVLTCSESGYCGVHRKIVERRAERVRNPQPRNYRKSAVNGRLLAYALDEHLRIPRAEWVAARLWAANIEDVRDKFAHRRSLAAGIVKQFRHLGLTNITKRKSGFANGDSMRAMLDALLAEHTVEWPSAPAPEGMKEIPLEPFRAWLQQAKTEVGSYKALSARTGLNADNISKWIRGVGVGEGKRTIWKATVDSALRRYGDGTTYEHLYRS